MKKSILSFLLICLGASLSAQICVKKDSTGNFVYSEKPVYCDSITGKTLTLKNGEKIPVYITPAGAYYIIPDGKKFRRIYLNQK